MSVQSDITAILNQAFGDTLIPGSPTSETVYAIAQTITDYDPQTGVASGNAAAVTKKAIVRKYTRREIALSGGSVQAGDMQLVFLPADAPSIDDRINAQSRRFRIVSTEPVIMGDTILAVKCQGRTV